MKTIKTDMTSMPKGCGECDYLYDLEVGCWCCEAIPVPDTVEQDYDDEKGTGGLWDLAAEIALAVAAERGAETPCYAEEWGQERIYGLLKAREQENG